MGSCRTLIHYHGTPITPRASLLALGGRHFCVSYADKRDVQICHEIGQSVMLDNGAFSFWKVQKETDWDGYYEWCAPWLKFWTTWAVIPDVIDGTEEENDELIAEWPFGEAGAPVWHLHESLKRFEYLVQRWPRVCIGSSGQYAVVGDSAWHRRMHEAMELVCGHEGTPPAWLHMLRGLSLAGGPYPFASVDSTNIARNHKGSWRQESELPHAMAQRLDVIQCPAVWISAEKVLRSTA